MQCFLFVYTVHMITINMLKINDQSGVQSCTSLHVTNADIREGKIYGGALKPPPSSF